MMQAVFSEPKLIHGKFGDEYELKVSGRYNLFQAWVNQSPDSDLCAYFRAVSDGIAQRNLDDYHLKICNGKYDSKARTQQQKWSVIVLYGETGAEGPLMVSRCMSCDMQCPLLLGVLGQQDTAAAAAAAAAEVTNTTAASDKFLNDSHQAVAANCPPAPAPTPTQKQSPVSQDSLLQETEHCRVWLDAKARPMFVITPKKHLEKLSDLSDAELVDLFRTAVAVVHDMGCSSFNTMVLNHGDNRNHAHLHLKVRVHEAEFEKAAQGWSTKHKEQLQLLRDFRDSLPVEKRGTREAFLMRIRGRQQQQQQHWQQPRKQQRANRQQEHHDWRWRGPGQDGQQHDGWRSQHQHQQQQHQQQHGGWSSQSHYHQQQQQQQHGRWSSQHHHQHHYQQQQQQSRGHESERQQWQQPPANEQPGQRQ